MKALAFESLVDVLALIGAAIGTSVLTIAGVLTEQAGVQNVLAGDVLVGGWELWMGTLALFVGVYLLGYQQFWRRLRLASQGR